MVIQAYSAESGHEKAHRGFQDGYRHSKGEETRQADEMARLVMHLDKWSFGFESLSSRSVLKH